MSYAVNSHSLFNSAIWPTMFIVICDGASFFFLQIYSIIEPYQEFEMVDNHDKTSIFKLTILFFLIMVIVNWMNFLNLPNKD